MEIYHQPDYQRKVMENYPDYSSEEYLDGWGWHEDQLVPVPGFGFFPSQMKEELEEEAQVFINLPCQHFHFPVLLPAPSPSQLSCQQFHFPVPRHNFLVSNFSTVLFNILPFLAFCSHKSHGFSCPLEPLFKLK